MVKDIHNQIFMEEDLGHWKKKKKMFNIFYKIIILRKNVRILTKKVRIMRKKVRNLGTKVRLLKKKKKI